MLEGAELLPLGDLPPPAGAVSGEFRSIEWEIVAGVVILTWSWDGPPAEFSVHRGGEAVLPRQEVPSMSFADKLWPADDNKDQTEKKPGIYHYRVAAYYEDGDDEASQEIICGPVVVGRLVWDEDPAARETCTHFAVYLRKLGPEGQRVCVYVAPLPEPVKQENGVTLRRIFSSDVAQTRVEGERQLLFGETRSAAVARCINTALQRSASSVVRDDDVWDFLALRKNGVALTFCKVTANGLPDPSWQSALSEEVPFTYRHDVLYPDE